MSFCVYWFTQLEEPGKIIFFFFNDTATTEIYTLSLHDALPISMGDCPRLELSTRSASGPGETQAVGPLRQPSKRRWCWTGRLPRSPAGRRTVNLEPHGQALGLKHGLLSLKAPDFSPGDVYANWVRKPRSFSKKMRMSSTPYLSIAIRSTPMPNA